MRHALMVALVLTAHPIAAQEPPPIVLDGLKALVRSGIDTAVAVWLKGSPIQNDTASVTQITKAFTQLPTWFGKPVDFEILKTYLVGTHFKRTYAIALFEGGPVYFRFDYYSGSKGWLMQHLDFNTDRTKILPRRPNKRLKLAARA
jgi:hypothetical protein